MECDSRKVAWYWGQGGHGAEQRAVPAPADGAASKRNGKTSAQGGYWGPQ